MILELISYKNKIGLYHRLDGPAVVYENGTELWFKNGILHRENGPAAIYSNGLRIWYIDGKERKQKLSKKSRRSLKDGVFYYKNKAGNWHRDNGPAVIGKNSESWYKNGQLHREDGPAVIEDGKEYYFLNGYSQKPERIANTRKSVFVFKIGNFFTLDFYRS